MSDTKTQPAADSGSPSLRDRKNVVLAGAVGLAVVLGLGAYFLVFAGSSDEAESGLVAGAARNSAPAVASPTPTPSATLPAVFKADPFGNPFKPLYPPAPEPVEPEAAAPVQPAPDPAVVPGANPVQPVVQPVPAPPTSKLVTLTLVRIVDEDTVSVRVDGAKAFTTNQGQVFGDVFSLASIPPDKRGATFNFGDGEQITLLVGQSKQYSVTS